MINKQKYYALDDIAIIGIQQTLTAVQKKNIERKTAAAIKAYKKEADPQPQQKKTKTPIT